MMRQLAEGAKRFVHLVKREPPNRRRTPAHHSRNRSRLGRRGEMIVTVESLAGKRHEQRTSPNRAGIGRDRRERDLGAARTGAQSQGLTHLSLRPRGNRRTLPLTAHGLPLTAFCTISRSSKGSFSVPMT